MNTTFYFPHNYSTRNNPKIIKLMMKLGYEGYGLFWALLEELYINSNKINLDYDCLAYSLKTTADKIKTIIEDFDLFEFNNNILSSKGVNKRLQEREKKSNKAKKSIEKRWEKYNRNTNELQTNYDRNTTVIQGKEKKGKEKKVKENKINIYNGSTSVSPESNNLIYFDDREKKLVCRDEFFNRLKESYSNIDIQSELKKAELWVVSNPNKQKKNYARFINNWLMRCKTNNFIDETSDCDFTPEDIIRLYKRKKMTVEIVDYCKNSKSYQLLNKTTNKRFWYDTERGVETAER